MSPLFPHIHSDTAVEVRVTYMPAEPEPVVDLENLPKDDQGRIIVQGRPGGKLSIKMEKVLLTDCQPIESVEAAEDVILNLGDIIEHEIELEGKDIPSYFAGITIQALRYCNIVSQRTRRGSGNVILMGRDSWQKVEDAYKAIGSDGLQTVPSEMNGRWEKKGLLVGGISVYVGDGIPANEVFVAYVGPGTAIDGPGGLLKVGDDLYLRVMSNNATALGNAADYVQRFRITTK